VAGLCGAPGLVGHAGRVGAGLLDGQEGAGDELVAGLVLEAPVLDELAGFEHQLVLVSSE
jgi:hypothetical protein